MPTEYGDPQAAIGNEILRSVVGSGVHGIAIEGTDDHDEMGVYVEPPHHVLTIGSAPEHYTWRSQSEGHRSGPGDTDLIIYGLRKYLHLAVKGNPTALLPLFAPKTDLIVTTPLGLELRQMRDAFLSQAAARRFLGYMRNQRERIVSGKRTPNRPELVDKYGYDVKYASHALRLAWQGLELTRDGRLTLPLPDYVRARVLMVKRGERSDVELVLADIDKLAADVERRLSSGDTPLPPEPDRDRIQAWCESAYARSWDWPAA